MVTGLKLKSGINLKVKLGKLSTQPKVTKDPKKLNLNLPKRNYSSSGNNLKLVANTPTETNPAGSGDLKLGSSRPVKKIPLSSGGGSTEKTLSVSGGKVSSTSFTPKKVGIPPLKPVLGVSFSPPIKPLAPRKKLDRPKLKLVSGGTTNFKPVQLAGISNQRPELLSLVDYHPIYKNNSRELTKEGKYLNTILSARDFRNEEIKNLIKQLSEGSSTKDIVNSIRESWKEEMDFAKEEVEFLSSIAKIMRQGKKSLDLRKFSGQEITNNSRSFKGYFTNELQFTEDGFKNFSNSKLYAQLIFDMKVAASQYSPLLFDATDVDRQKDKDPILVDKTVNLNDGKFSFNIENFFSSNSDIIHMSDQREHERFIKELPFNFEDKVKLLMMLISKEIRVSFGLGSPSAQSILEEVFGAETTGNPFNFILGEPGEKITDVQRGGSSLASIYRFSGDDNTIVLPFEKSFLADENGKTYVPGNTYLVDPILESNTKFDLSRIRNFRNDFETKVDGTIGTFNSLLRLNKVQGDPTLAESLFQHVLSDVVTILDASTEESGITKNSVMLAIISSVNSDPKLKAMLFQYILLRGLSDDPLGEAFGRMVKFEFDDLSSFSEVRQRPESVVNPKETEISDKVRISSEATTLAFELSRTILEKINNYSGFPIDPKAETENFVQEVISESLLDIESNSILVKIMEFMNYVEVLMENRGLVDDQTGRSRFNFLSVSTRSVMAFELYITLLSRFSHTFFVEKIRRRVEGAKYSHEIKISTNRNNIAVRTRAIRNTIRDFGKTIQRKKVGPELSLSSDVGISSFDVRNKQNLKTNLPLSSKESKLENKTKNSIGEALRKLRGEDDFLRDGISLLKKVFDRIDKSTDRLEEFFNQKGPNRSFLTRIQNELDGNEKLALLDEQQVNLAYHLLDDAISDNISTTSQQKELISKYASSKMGRKDFWKPFSDGSDIPMKAREVLLDKLNEDIFAGVNSRDIKILTVGIPSGFSSNLRQRVDVSESDEINKNPQEIDVISIDVYKKDLEFEDIVFKPKRYIFELSRFISRRRLSLSDENILQIPHSIQRNFSSETGVFLDSSDVEQDKRYFFLNKNDRRELVENHLNSYLLGLYIKIFTGMSTFEEDYLISENFRNNPLDQSSREQFENLILGHVNELAGKRITLNDLSNASQQISDLLSKLENTQVIQSSLEEINNVVFEDVPESASIEITENLINLMKLYSPKSLLASPSSKRKQITSPKLFERIFNIPIDPNDFEVDVIKSGFSIPSLVKNVVSGRLIQTTNEEGEEIIKVKPKSTRENSVVMEQFFITVSTVGGHVI